MKTKEIIMLFLIGQTVIGCGNQQSEKSKNKQEETQVSITQPKENESGKIKGIIGGCGYNYTPEQATIILYKPRLRELNQINSILKFSGLPLNFEVYIANINNAVATIINNKRYILYDPKLLSYTDLLSGDYWNSMSILAHEIGHHLSGHTMTNEGSNPHDELEADKYSGFVLYKLGATLPQAIGAIQKLGSESATYSHPAKSERIKAIALGWNEANQTRNNGAVPPPLSDDLEYTDFELTLKDLYDMREFNEDHPNYSYSNYGFFEGIITDTDGPDKDLGYNLNILITKRPFNPTYKLTPKNIKTYFSYPSGEASMALRRSFIEVFKPGRKITFNIVLEGVGGDFTSLTYIKVQTR